jgi:cytochrome c oxidase subunit 4
MSEGQVLSPAEVEEEHAAESHSPYFKIWLLLVAVLFIEYLSAIALNSFAVPLVVALFVWVAIQTSTMGWWFMHLKFEGRWVYGLLIAAAVLSLIVVLALVPDIGMRSSGVGTDLEIKVSSSLERIIR